MRGAVLAALAAWGGATLVLSELPWFRHRPLAERVRPYAPAGDVDTRPVRPALESFRDVIGPIARDVGTRAAQLIGAADDLDRHLARLHSPLDATAFRLRQLGWSLVGFAVGAVATLVWAPPPELGLLFTLGSPALCFLVVEHQIASRSRAWQVRLRLELPVVAEQLGMLLSAGHSLGGALNRLAARGKGVSGPELALVCARTRQGLTEIEALREWADRAAVDGLDRFVSVLVAHRDGGDLGRVVTGEARAARADEHRTLIAAIERRSQQVWIPVTVATLVPGVIFLAVPFVEAMRLFAGS